jgi:hypothetical protein
MKQRIARGMRGLMAALMAGTLAQVTCTGADNAYITTPRLVTEGVLTSVDFCHIFDCQSGFLGGAIQPCGQNPLLVDCPAPPAAAN